MSEIKINDFVVRFANVNGTGSASANFLFTKAILEWASPLHPKHFPRATYRACPPVRGARERKGYPGRRKGVDLMVAVNPQSLMQDVKSVRRGGYLLYDSTKSCTSSLFAKT